MVTPGGQRGGGRVLARRYHLQRVLGRGAMGAVWEAEDTFLRRTVAVKEVVLPGSLSPEERAVSCERTLREARAIARLGHPNVVTLFDVLDEDSRPWVVMELVPSRSLAEVIKEDGPLHPLRVATVGLAILGALEAAHAAGITHRDVKPGNILLGHDGRVKLTDFGIARAAGDDTITGTGLLVGSPSYIAPEIVKGQEAGAPADLWGLGATLYASVEGRAPFSGGDAMETLSKVVQDPPTPYVRAGSLVPALDAMLDKDPIRRARPVDARRMLLDVLRGGSDTESPPARAARSVASPSLSRTPAPAAPAPAAPAAPPAPAASPAPSGPGLADLLVPVWRADSPPAGGVGSGAAAGGAAAGGAAVGGAAAAGGATAAGPGRAAGAAGGVGGAAGGVGGAAGGAGGGATAAGTGAVALRRSERPAASPPAPAPVPEEPTPETAAPTVSASGPGPAEATVVARTVAAPDRSTPAAGTGRTAPGADPHDAAAATPGGVPAGPGGVPAGPGGVPAGPGGVPAGPGGTTAGPGAVTAGPGGATAAPAGATAVAGPAAGGAVGRSTVGSLGERAREALVIDEDLVDPDVVDPDLVGSDLDSDTRVDLGLPPEPAAAGPRPGPGSAAPDRPATARPATAQVATAQADTGRSAESAEEMDTAGVAYFGGSADVPPSLVGDTAGGEPEDDPVRPDLDPPAADRPAATVDRPATADRLQDADRPEVGRFAATADRLATDPRDPTADRPGTAAPDPTADRPGTAAPDPTADQAATGRSAATADQLGTARPGTARPAAAGRPGAGRPAGAGDARDTGAGDARDTGHSGPGRPHPGRDGSVSGDPADRGPVETDPSEVTVTLSAGAAAAAAGPTDAFPPHEDTGHPSGAGPTAAFPRHGGTRLSGTGSDAGPTVALPLHGTTRPAGTAARAEGGATAAYPPHRTTRPAGTDPRAEGGAAAAYPPHRTARPEPRPEDGATVAFRAPTEGDLARPGDPGPDRPAYGTSRPGTARPGTARPADPELPTQLIAPLPFGGPSPEQPARAFRAQPPAGPAGPLPGFTEERPRSDRRRRALAALLVAAGLVVAIVLGAILLVDSVRTRGDDSPGAGPGSPAATAGPAPIPAGYTRYAGTGFSVGVPRGWPASVQREGVVDVKEPGTTRFLRLITVDSTAPAEEQLTIAERQFAADDDYADYRRVRLEKVDYRGLDAADWEFTFTLNGVPRHVVYRGVVTGDRTYGLYLSTPESQWASSRDVFRRAADTFTTG